MLSNLRTKFLRRQWPQARQEQKETRLSPGFCNQPWKRLTCLHSGSRCRTGPSHLTSTSRCPGFSIPVQDHLAGLAWPHGFEALLEVIDVEVMGDDEIISAQDLQNLRKYDIYSKLLIDGMPSPVFSATTFWPINDHLTVPKQDAAKIRAISREKYAKPRDFIEKKIHEYGNKVTDDEKKFKQNQDPERWRAREKISAK